jgi:hypothetical protein
MSRVPHSSDVDHALKGFRAAAQKSLQELNDSAAQRMSKGDYSAAAKYAASGKAVRQFQLDVEALHKRWRETRQGTDHKAKGTVSPLWGFFQPVLQALISCDGEGQIKELEQQVELSMADILLPGDRELMARGRERWRVMVRRTRMPLISEGWIEDRAGASWKITDAGRLAAKKPASQRHRGEAET